METVYVIIEANSYDAFNTPYNDQFYLDEQQAKEDCKRLNKAAGYKVDYFDVHELTLKK